MHTPRTARAAQRRMRRLLAAAGFVAALLVWAATAQLRAAGSQQQGDRGQERSQERGQEGQGAAEPPAPTPAPPAPRSAGAAVPLCWPTAGGDEPVCQWWKSAGWVCPPAARSAAQPPEGCSVAGAEPNWQELLRLAPGATVWIFGDGLMHQQYALAACAAARDGVARRRWITHTKDRLGAGSAQAVPPAKGKYRSRLPLFRDPLFMFHSYLNFARHGIVGEPRPNSEWAWGVEDGVLMKGLEIGGGEGEARLVFQMLAPERRSASEHPAAALSRAPLRKGDVVVIAIGADYSQDHATLLRSHQRMGLEWLRANASALGLRGAIWAEPLPQRFPGAGSCAGEDAWRREGGGCAEAAAAGAACLPRWELAAAGGAGQLRNPAASCGGFCHPWMAALNQQLHRALRAALSRPAP
eukprot:TRINITY_DN15479_c0_g1_i1.p2 TRINITY_DN15479_c0_g1~~TRINITY_DN15479_c0_g1_i1.p2  ORF type:complete len:412 (+),score=122.11 TRINITY_DN15479_c0_g1_i1:54-1289(+)